MSTQPIIIEFGSYRWPRHLAIHEAGHAIAAWFFGIQEVEIALSGNNRVAKPTLAAMLMNVELSQYGTPTIHGMWLRLSLTPSRMMTPGYV